jgi:hypothetical protein
MNEEDKKLFDLTVRQRLPLTPYPEPLPEGSWLTPSILMKMGYSYWMQKGEDVYGIVVMTFGKGRVCSNLNAFGYDDFWCFENYYASVDALIAWDPAQTNELQGWFRNFSTSRRREGGDPNKGHIQP